MKQHYLVLFLLGIFFLTGSLFLDRWRQTLYHGDSNGYYLHVVSFFVNQDVGDYDQTITSLLEVNPSSADPRNDPFGVRLTEKGRRYIKYTLGVPFMEAPFFLLAHAYAKLSGTYAANGWTLPYLFSVGLLATLFYVLLGFHLLMIVLNRYFPRRITLLTIVALAVATNLFYHLTYVTMAHGFLFFDYCLLIYLSDRFYERPGIWKALGIGAVVGLIALTRVPEVISLLVPLLWGIGKWNDVKERFRFFTQHYYFLIMAAVGLGVVFLPQIIYWHYVSGHWIFNPYQGEGFNFWRPRIHKGWFDFANGWLIYTPIMGLSLIGLFWLRKYTARPLLATLAFVLLHVYIHYSYYVWTYFPGLGQRPMVETYPLLSFGLAAFFAFCYEKKGIKWLPLSAIVVFGALNLFQTWQMREGIIWTERGNHAFYWETFGRLHPTLNSLRSYDTKSFQPDSSDIRLVENVLTEGFEDSLRYTVSPDLKYQGDFSLFPAKDTIWLRKGVGLSEEAKKASWLGIGIQAYMREADKIWNRDLCMRLVVWLRDENGRVRKESYIVPSAHIGNKDYSIWTTGEVNRWGKASFFVRIPAALRKNGTFDIFLVNTHAQELYLDELKIKAYE